MSQSAKARAKAVQMLEEHVTDLKRMDRAARTAIQSARAAQAEVLGISIDPTQPGGKVDPAEPHTDEDQD